MALIALKRGGSSSTLTKFLNQFRSVLSSSTITRSFNNNIDARSYDEDKHSIDVARRSGSPASRRRDDAPSFFSDVFDPFSTRSVSQLLNMMDQFMDNPMASAARGIGAGVRRGWDVKEDKDGLYLKMDMPGLGKEHVNISVEQNTLIIRGEGEKEWGEEEERGRRYSSRIELTPNLYKTDQIKAEMKNGILKVVLPKVKEEGRKDVFQVQID